MSRITRPQVSLYNSKIVIFIALVNIIRFSQCAPTSLEDFDDLSSPSTSSPCNLTNFTLDCSNQKLTAIPKNIPNTIQYLNLSHNSLEAIEEDAFDECCENLKVLSLSHNGISTLTRRHFEKLKKLEIIFLDSNQISALQAETFQSLYNLKRLDLSRNPLELQKSPFLIQESLLELNLDFCGLEDIPEATFRNLTQLTNLTLAGNKFDENMDVEGFEPLKNLLHLSMPDLSQSTTYEICEKLLAIDTINFASLNITCIVLGDDKSFEEAIVKDDVEEPKVQSLQPPTTRPTTTTTTTEPSTTVSTTTISSSSLLPALNKENSADTAKIETSDSTNKTKIDTGTASIDIDNDTIKFILVGIFAVTVFGILIGLICRADVCGIKTKLCRSKKSNRRQETATDTVSPFEEIPLNTINGKTHEGGEG